MSWELFIGRFHPLMVHLPIGIFILGYLFELSRQFGSKYFCPSRKSIIIIYSVGLLAGIAAAATGWLLSQSEDYGIIALDDHKIAGISTLVVMLLVIVILIKGSNIDGKVKLLSSTIAIILMSITGHLGGNLTHGASYLVEYAPMQISPRAPSRYDRVSNITPDSVIIYKDLLKPAIQDKCLACHNTSDNKGGLVLVGYQNWFAEADHGTPIAARNPEQSELLKRVTLAYDDEKIMPPKGPGISYTDIQILIYWIENGADSLQRFNPESMEEELVDLLERDYGLDYHPKPYYEKVKVDSLDEAIILDVRNSGFNVSYLGLDNLLLDVAYNNDSINQTNIDLLNQLATHVTFLKMADCNLTNNLIKEMPVFQHLTRIDLSNNQIFDELIPFLSKQPNLETVNLHDTDLNYSALQSLLDQTNVKKVYIWNTKMSDEEIALISNNYPTVEIVSGFEFEEFVPANSVFGEKETE
jgi:uncharacterized membrane protein